MSPFLALQLVASLAVVIGAIWLATRLAGKHFGKTLTGGSGASVTSRTPLSRHAHLMVVAHRDRELLLGVTDTSVTLIADHAAPGETGTTSAGKSLPTVMRELTGRRLDDVDPTEGDHATTRTGFAGHLAGATAVLRGTRSTTGTGAPHVPDDANTDVVGGDDAQEWQPTQTTDFSPGTDPAPDTMEIDLSALAPPVGMTPDTSIPPPIPAPRHQGLAENWQRTLDNLRDRTVRR